MASIIDFLPKKTQEKIKKDNAKFEKTFNLPSGTVEKLNIAKGGSSSSSGRSSSSGGGSSSSSSSSNTYQFQTYQQEQQEKARQEAQRLAEERQKQQEKQRQLQEQKNKQLVNQQKEIGIIEKTSLNLQEMRRRLREQKEKEKLSLGKRTINELAGFELMVGQAVTDTAYLGKQLVEVSPAVLKYTYNLRKPDNRRELSNNLKTFSKIATNKIKKVVKDPEERKRLVNNTKTFTKQSINYIKNNPGESVGFIGGEILLTVGGGKLLKGASKLTGKIVNKLDPRVVKIVKEGGKEIIDLGKKGRLVVGGVKEGAESVSKALARGGTKANAVSAQANKLVGLIKRKNVIRKPLPSALEDSLKPSTKTMLKKFDEGKLNPKQILQLNKKIRQESLKIAEIKQFQPKGIDLLERSTYFDPDGLLRKSRLAVNEQQEGTLFDLIRGKASLFGKKTNPQILVLDEYIEALPKTKEFSKIRKKLLKNQPLNKDELARLTRFQVTPSGKLKPIGSTTFAGGIEREVTLAPGEIIKRIKTLGILDYKGKRIPIVAIKVLKGKEKVSKLNTINKLTDQISKLKDNFVKTKNVKIKNNIKKKINSLEKKINNKISKTKNKELKDFLKKYKRGKQKKVYPTKRRLTQLVTTLRKRKRTNTRKTTTRPVRGTPKRPTRKTTTRPVKGTPTRPVRGIPTRPVRGIPTRPIIPRIPSGFKQKKLTKKAQGYYVVERVRGKLKKLEAKPLSLKDAKDYLAHRVDNRLSRTAFYIPAGQTKILAKPPKPIQGYYSKNSKKLRPYKIRMGKRKTLLTGFIEKRKYNFDTPGEKRQSKFLSKTTTKKRKITPAQRKVLLQRLKKARAVKAKKNK